MQVISRGLLCCLLGFFASALRFPLKGPTPDGAAERNIVKSGTRRCIRPKYREQKQTLQIHVQIWGGSFWERFEEFNLRSVTLWFMTRLHHHVNTAKDSVSTSDHLPLGFWTRKGKNASEKYGPQSQAPAKPLNQTGD